MLHKRKLDELHDNISYIVCMHDSDITVR